MKITHYHLDMDPETGGVVRAVLDLCTAVAEAGHDVRLLTPDVENLPDAWRETAPGSPSAVRIGAPTRPGGLYSSAALREMTPHVDDADVLHLHGMWTPSNLQIASLARRRNRPYVYSVHGMLDDWCMAQRGLKKRLYLATVGTRMLHGAAAVHCTAQAELDQARAWFPRGHGVVVPLVLDLEPFLELPGRGPAEARFAELDGSRPAVLFLSRIHYKKGLELLIHAADRLRQDGRDFVVLVAGSGEAAFERRLRDLVTSLSLDTHVKFVGFVSGVEKISLYESADVYVLPTSQENFGFVLFEALAATAPVLTTRGVDTWPELEESGGAVIVDGQADAIADAIAALIDDPSRRERMGRDGRQWVMDNLSGDRVTERYEELYRACMTARTE